MKESTKDKVEENSESSDSNIRAPINFVAIGWLSVFGIAVSAYLTWIHWFPSSTFCSAVGDCEAVNSSPYATLGNIPIAILGLIMYLSVLALAWVGKSNYRQQSDTASLTIFGFSLLGVLFSGYLTYIELYVIHAICPWCVTSAILISLIFLLSMRSFSDWMRG